MHGFRQRIGVAGAALLLVCYLGSCATTPPTGAAGTTTLSIVGTNDLHGALLPARGNGGIAVFAGYVANLRAERARDGGAVVLVDAGDMWQGTLESNTSEGAAVVDVYNALDYAAAAVGNHEFDFGPVGPAVTPAGPGDDPRGVLKARAAEATFPLLAANTIDTRTGDPVDWNNVMPSAIRDYAGVRVGFVGVLTERALPTIVAANTVGLRIAPIVDSVTREARQLRDQGADVIIVTSHAGGRCERFDDPDDLSGCNLANEIFRVARALPQGLVDVIVAGHLHEGIAHRVNGIAMIASFAHGRAFGRVDVSVAKDGGRVVGVDIHQPTPICEFFDPASFRCTDDEAQRVHYAGAPVHADPDISALLDTLVGEVAQLSARPVGVTLHQPIRMNELPDSPMGNLVTDVLLHAVPTADIGLYNTVGGVRAALPAGDITVGHLFQVVPFDNAVVSFDLTGAELESVLAAQLGRGRGALGSVNLAGARVSATCSDGRFDLELVRDDGRTITADDRLVVVTTDFLATGGGRVFAPVEPAGGLDYRIETPNFRDELVRWFGDVGDAINDGRYHGNNARRFAVDIDLRDTCS